MPFRTIESNSIFGNDVSLHSLIKSKPKHKHILYQLVLQAKKDLLFHTMLNAKPFIWFIKLQEEMNIKEVMFCFIFIRAIA